MIAVHCLEIVANQPNMVLVILFAVLLAKVLS